MHISPQSKTVTYSLDNIASAEQSIDEIQKTVLEDDSISGDIARSICSDLRSIRDSLSLKPGVHRHKKWAPEMKEREI
jgi:hypothetical protein